MSVSALHLYEQLTEAPDDKARAKVIAEAFGQLEDRYPQLKEIATQGHVRESELRLQKEIEGVRLEIKQVEAKIKDTELRLQKEIEGVRLEIKEVEVRLTQAMHRQSLWVIGSVGTIVGGIRLLDWFLAHLPAT